MISDIRARVRVLLRFYPGPSRWSWTWLVLVPLGFSLAYWLVSSLLLRVPISTWRLARNQIGILASVPLGLVGLLAAFRVAWVSPGTLRTALLISITTAAYVIVLWVPAILVTWSFGVHYVGISVSSVFKMVLGVVCLAGVFSGAAVVAGYIGYRKPSLVPLLIPLAVVSMYRIPVGNPLNWIPAHRLLVYLFLYPCAPLLELLRTSIGSKVLAYELALPAALLQGAVGYVVLVLAWRHVRKTAQNVTRY